MSVQITYGQDHENTVDAGNSQFPFSPGDTRYIKSQGRTVYDFVGFVLHKERTLAVFPKHYFTEAELSDRNKGLKNGEEDVFLLFKVLCKYMEDTATKAKAKRYFGSAKEFESDYPFHAFFEVYDYYKRYGIYYEEENVIVAGQKGKISWKHTIQRSNVLINGDNIVYLPLYSKSKNSKGAFISDCMVFVINNTIRNFPFFLSLKPIPAQTTSLDYIGCKDYVLRMLYQCQSNAFKDIHKRLLSSLISFFEEIEDRKQGGSVHIKMNYFDRIWQTMVNKYLNDCFAKMDTVANQLVFDETLTKSSVDFHVVTYKIDNSPHQFEIELDHYGTEKGIQYIFDSKYYYGIKDLNYKQFVYDVVMDHDSNRKQSVKTYSALLLPGDEPSSLHLDLKSDFGNLAHKKHTIIEQYLNVKAVMKHYVGII